MSFWRKNGSPGPIGNAAGALIQCATCPCECYTDVVDAINERGSANDAAYTPIPYLTGGVPWTLSELITKVNSLAPTYLDGVFPYGDTSIAPDTLSGTYATGATDYCDLLDRVKAMITKVIPFTPDVSALYTKDSPSPEATIAAAVASCKSASWVETTARYIESWWRALGIPGEYYARIQNSPIAIELTGMWTGIAKTIRLAMRVTNNGVWSKQGLTDLGAQDKWATPYTSGALSAATSSHSALYGNEDIHPPDEPTVHGYLGFVDSGSNTYLIDWDFTLV